MLDNTQTFFGVLVTLAVLQLFYQEGNYFTSLIKYLVKESKKYLKQWKRELENSQKANEHQIEQAGTQEELEYYQISTSKLWLGETQARLTLDKNSKSIYKQKIPQLVALYTFLWGLVFMLIDPFFVPNEFAIGFTVYYLTLSFAFTAALWRKYCLLIGKERHKTTHRHIKSPKRIDYRILNLLFTQVIIIALYFLIPFQAIWWRMLLLLLIFYMMGMCDKFYISLDCNRRFILIHAAGVFISSLIGGLLYALYPVSNSPEFWEQNQQLIRLLLITYQLVNLILIPLGIVGYKYYNWEKAYKKYLANIEDDLNDIAHKIIDRHI